MLNAVHMHKGRAWLADEVAIICRDKGREECAWHTHQKLIKYTVVGVSVSVRSSSIHSVPFLILCMTCTHATPRSLVCLQMAGLDIHA